MTEVKVEECRQVHSGEKESPRRGRRVVVVCVYACLRICVAI